MVNHHPDPRDNINDLAGKLDEMAASVHGYTVQNYRARQACAMSRQLVDMKLETSASQKTGS